MKIDLRKDKGVLGSVQFLVASAHQEELSEDERIAETMRRRRSGNRSETTDASSESDSHSEKALSPQKNKSPEPAKRHAVRQIALFILLLITFAYYLYDKGELYSSIDFAKKYVVNLLGIAETEIDTLTSVEAPPDSDGVLPESLFNELMPVTPHIAALADSIASLPAESLYVDPNFTDDSIEYDYVYTPVVEKQIKLSDDDVTIINNRSLLLLTTELLDDIPTSNGNVHLFLKRDALTITAPRGGEWVGRVKSTLDKFVSGSFNEDYSSGSAKLNSKFEIILYAEPDFRPQVLTALKLLDALAIPFNDYLKQIIIDLPRGVDDNPAKFTFAGSIQEIQYVLSSWAESRYNIRLTSIDIETQGEEFTLNIGAVFFNYTP